MNKTAFIVLVGSMFISMLGMGIVSPFLPIFANQLGASSMQVGLVQAGFNLTGIGTGFGPVALGGIADLLGIQSVFYSASICMAAGLAVFAWMVRNDSGNIPTTDTGIQASLTRDLP